MNPLRKKLARFLIDTAKRGIDALDPDSTHARELKKVNVDAIIREDVAKICATVSVVETTKIFSLYARLQAAPAEKKEPLKGELRKLAQDVVNKAGDRFGKFKIPESCRQLLWTL